MHERCRSIGTDVDDADTAPGEAGVDAENAESGCHRSTLGVETGAAALRLTSGDGAPA